MFSEKVKGRPEDSRRSGTDLLLRKQFWITLMMKEAASFSLRPGLNRCLRGRKKNKKTTIISNLSGSDGDASVQFPARLHSLEQLNSLSSEAGEASVQHERHQGDHGVHVGSAQPHRDQLSVFSAVR